MAQFTCVSCGYHRKYRDDHLGREIKCPQCATIGILEPSLGDGDQAELSIAHQRSVEAHQLLLGMARAKAADSESFEAIDVRLGPNPTTAALAQAACDLAKHHIRRGFSDRDLVIDKVHGDLVKILPELTRRQTMDLISDALLGRPWTWGRLMVEVKQRWAAIMAQLQLSSSNPEIQQKLAAGPATAARPIGLEPRHRTIIICVCVICVTAIICCWLLRPYRYVHTVRNYVLDKRTGIVQRNIK
ncbi:MAG: hypothetical protein L0228_22200 [Planctomycetes bacterium]|nr:hypothetical protein [Planctomycetota bacterium]